MATGNDIQLPDDYRVPEDASQMQRYDIKVWRLNDGWWTARPDQWPMIECKAVERSAAILGCIAAIDRESDAYDPDQPQVFERVWPETVTGTCSPEINVAVFRKVSGHD